MSLTRNHSSLELLCQTAGALEACDGGNEPLLEAVPQMDMPRVSPTNLVAGGASSTTPIIAPTQSPFDNSSLVSSSRANSSQYLVGTSPSHDSFSGSGFEDDDDMEDPAVPSQHRPWVLNDGHHVVNIRESYIKTLGQPSRIAGHQPSFAPSGRSSSFCPPIPTLRHTRGYPTHDNGANPIYSPVIGYDNRHAMSQTQAYMDASSAGGAGWPSVQDLVAENSHLRSQLCDKDRYIESLMAEVSNLQGQVSSLKSLPVGKISQIPVDDLLEIMREYGSEVSENAVPPRKGDVQKASVVRQFRRWNPSFFEYFEHRHGKWVPKLGKKGELERRERIRHAHTTKGATLRKPGAACYSKRHRLPSSK